MLLLLQWTTQSRCNWRSWHLPSSTFTHRHFQPRYEYSNAQRNMLWYWWISPNAAGFAFLSAMHPQDPRGYWIGWWCQFGISVRARSDRMSTFLYDRLMVVRVKLSVINVLEHALHVVRRYGRGFWAVGDSVQRARERQLLRWPSAVTVHDVSVSSHSLQWLCVHHQRVIVACRHVRWASQTVCQCLDVHDQPHQHTSQLDTAKYVHHHDSQVLFIRLLETSYPNLFVPRRFVPLASLLLTLTNSNPNPLL